MSKNQWIPISEYLPKFGEVVQIFNEFYGTLTAKRVQFIVPTKNPLTKMDEFWYWDIQEDEITEVLLLSEAVHWRPL